MQKALKWLDARGTEYVFHNYKESGIDKATITEWLKHLPLDKVVNLRSTTYKELTAEEKADTTNKTKAIALMIKHNSLIKRPLWNLGNGKFYLGWNEMELSQLI